MFTFYDKHLTFKRQDKDILKKQVKMAFEAGINGAQKIEANDTARAKVVGNITALERTLGLFPELNAGSSLVKLSREALAQEQKWLAHWDKCIAETKRGYEQLVAASKLLREEAFAAGVAKTEKEVKAQREQERAAQARAQQEKQQQNNQKGQQNQKDGNNNNQNKNNQNQNKDNKKPAVLVVERMVVQQVDRGNKKKDKKSKADKTFYQVN